MKILTVDLGDRSYPIYIGSGVLKNFDIVKRYIRSKQILIVTNETIAPLYLQSLMNGLSDYQVESIVLHDGEQFKNLTITNRIFDALLENKFNRSATLIALGGGVIGDITGFAAACYQRGVNFIQIPTTLLSQVDSSVGGKTGVNHALGKNMIGAFYQPQCVIADTDVLNTLDDRELSAGIAEVIKYGLIRDQAFFEWLEKNLNKLLERDKDALAYAIERSCLNKAEVVAEDEKESGLRAILNLGHTFGHAIETGCGYGVYLHGEAVAIGTCQAADLSRRLGWLNDQDVERIVQVFKHAQLPVTPPIELNEQQFMDLMAVDKKNINGEIRLVLLKAIGLAPLPLNVDSELLKQTLNYYGR